MGPDGSLYISEDQRGRIWRVVYTGEHRGSRPVATQQPESGGATATPPEGIHPNAGAEPRGDVMTPVPTLGPNAPAGVTPAMVALGDSIFTGLVAGGTCAGCHGTDAKGTTLAPDLTTNKWLWIDGSYPSIVRIIRTGVPKPKQHTGVMPPMGGARLTPEQLNAVAAYVWALSHQSR